MACRNKNSNNKYRHRIVLVLLSFLLLSWSRLPRKISPLQRLCCCLPKHFVSVRFFSAESLNYVMAALFPYNVCSYTFLSYVIDYNILNFPPLRRLVLGTLVRSCPWIFKLLRAGGWKQIFQTILIFLGWKWSFPCLILLLLLLQFSNFWDSLSPFFCLSVSDPDQF